MYGSHSVVWAQTVVPAAAGLVGVLIGGAIGIYGQKKERRHSYVTEQLQSFYSPMLGMRAQIRAKSEVRVKIRKAAGEAWAEILSAVGDDPEAKKELTVKRGAEFDRVIEYDKNQLTNELVPLYQKLLEHFSSHMWLAESSTLSFFGDLVEYVEVWNRFLSGGLPSEVSGKIDHDEDKLKPFYADLETQMNKLKAKLEK
jgi:hypothetical protein